MTPGRTYSAAPATRSTRSKAPKPPPRVARVAKWRTSPSLPLEGFAVLNDTPVACQTRGPTDPQGDRWHGEAVTDIVSRSRALSLSPTAPFLPTAEEMGERTPAETAFLHFLSALCLFAAVRFPSRNRRFPDRCRSPDCASTAFRCRCLLLRQKLFVLPCRRLRNNYIRAQRAHLPLPPQGGKGAI